MCWRCGTSTCVSVCVCECVCPSGTPKSTFHFISGKTRTHLDLVSFHSPPLLPRVGFIRFFPSTIGNAIGKPQTKQLNSHCHSRWLAFYMCACAVSFSTNDWWACAAHTFFHYHYFYYSTIGSFSHSPYLRIQLNFNEWIVTLSERRKKHRVQMQSLFALLLMLQREKRMG